MDIAQIRELKTETRREIQQAVMSFEEKTGLSISAIGLEKIDVTAHEKPERSYMTIVHIDIKI